MMAGTRRPKIVCVLVIGKCRSLQTWHMSLWHAFGRRSFSLIHQTSLAPVWFAWLCSPGRCFVLMLVVCTRKTSNAPSNVSMFGLPLVCLMIRWIRAQLVKQPCTWHYTRVLFQHRTHCMSCWRHRVWESPNVLVCFGNAQHEQGHTCHTSTTYGHFIRAWYMTVLEWTYLLEADPLKLVRLV